MDIKKILGMMAGSVLWSFMMVVGCLIIGVCLVILKITGHDKNG